MIGCIRNAFRVTGAALLCTAAQAVFAASPQSPANATACGQQVSYRVSLDKKQHTPAQPEPGKALVYFIHDAGTGVVLAYPTTLYALDGAWVGANHGDSYFAVSVDPGVHHVCSALQSSFIDQRVELAHLNAEAGKTYYYRTRLIVSRAIELLDLQPIDSDQGSFLAASYALSVSKPRK
jgi:hypothetical protein